MGIEYFLIALLFALIINFSDLYAIIKDEKAWTPVNYPPYSIGDDYHYYSSMNALMQHIQKKFGLLRETNLFLTPPNYLTIGSLLINLPVYYLGMKLFDQRYSVLFVRIFNAILLFLSISCLLYVLNLNKLLLNDYYIMSLTIMVFLLYPVSFDIRYLIKRTILFNVLNKKHSDTHAGANDLVRGVIQSTSAPVLLLVISYFVFFIQTSNAILPLEILLVLNIFLYFVYSILGSVFFIFVVTINALSYWYLDIVRLEFLEVIILTFINILFFLLQRKLLSGVVSSQEVFKLEMFSKFSARKYFYTLLTLLFSLVLFLSFTMDLMLLLLLSATFFVVFDLLLGDHGGRFWYRGMLVIYTVFLINYVNDIFYIDMYNYLFYIELFVLIIYFYTNTLYLYEKKAKIAVSKKALELAINYKTDKVIITDSIDLIWYMCLYSNNKMLFVHYSLQGNGYKRQMSDFIVMLLLLEYSKEEIYEIFNIYNEKTNMSVYSEKNLKRMQLLLFMVLYKRYNYHMKDDGMLNSNGDFTDAFFDFLDEVYNQSCKYVMSMDKSIYYIVKREELLDIGDSIE